MTHLKLALLVGFGVSCLYVFAFAVGVVLGFWRVAHGPRPETVVRYVDRVVPLESAKPVPAGSAHP